MSNLVLKPRVSEKAYAHSQNLNVYTFDVPIGASKQAISQSVTAQYSVGVINVRVASTAAKAKRTYRGRGKFVNGTTSTTRKAYVTLKEGDSLPFFADVEAETVKETK